MHHKYKIIKQKMQLPVMYREWVGNLVCVEIFEIFEARAALMLREAAWSSIRPGRPRMAGTIFHGSASIRTPQCFAWRKYFVVR